MEPSATSSFTAVGGPVGAAAESKGEGARRVGDGNRQGGGEGDGAIEGQGIGIGKAGVEDNGPFEQSE